MKTSLRALVVAFSAASSAFADRSAEELLGAVPDACPDEAYLAFNKTGDRRVWEIPYHQRIEVLEELLASEAKELKGRFLPKMVEFLTAVVNMRTWTYSAHDGDLKSFDNEQPIVELGSARYGLTVARILAEYADKLPADLVRRARAELERRVFVPYLQTAAEARADSKRLVFTIGEHWWFRTECNWNAVCHSLVVRAALAYYPATAPERANIIAAAVDAVPFFFSGFTDDGYCSEGANYWNYGYGHYLEMGVALRAAPEKVDIFRGPKARKIAEYGFAYKLAPNVSPLFADGGGWPDEPFLDICREVWPDIDPGRLAPRTDFANAQVTLVRDIAGGLALGLKGGHNDEFHNHNDVGSYNIAVGNVLVTGDVGGEVYTRRTFSKDRYVSKVLNSYGHPVPRVNGVLQGTGAAFRAKVLASETSENVEKVVLDLTKAYPCDVLKSLVRSFTVDRRAGTVSVSDTVEFTRPSRFEDPIVTVGSVADGVIAARGARLAFDVACSEPHETFAETIENPGKPSVSVWGVRLPQVTRATVTYTFRRGQ